MKDPWDKLNSRLDTTENSANDLEESSRENFQIDEQRKKIEIKISKASVTCGTIESHLT